MSAPLTQTQLPLEAILDIYGKQTYLGNTFSLPNAGTSVTTTTETPLVVIQNPALSGKSLFLFKEILFSSNNAAIFKFYFNPVVNVAGSATTPVNIRSGSLTTSIAKCYLGATITSTGTFFLAAGSTTISLLSDALIIIDQGNSLLITGTQDTTGTSLLLSENIWYEI